MVRRESVDRELRFEMNKLRIQSPELLADIPGLVNSFLDQFGQQQAKTPFAMLRRTDWCSSGDVGIQRIEPPYITAHRKCADEKRLCLAIDPWKLTVSRQNRMNHPPLVFTSQFRT